MKSETFYLNLLYGRGDFYYNFNKFLEINNGDGFYKLLRLCNDRKTYSKKLCVSDMFSKHFCGGLRKCLTLNKLSLEKLVVLAVDFIVLQNEHKIIERLFINCKTEVQNAFEIISEWFSLSEYNDWENYSFKELTEACNEITKSLFIGFNNLIINCNNNDSLMFKGYTFRDMVDVLLIVFNNAILHSGYKEQLQSLNLKVDLSMDSNFLYVSFENNLSDSVDLEKLDLKILDINENYLNKSYLRINTRQEGGMGLYKIMHTMFSVLKLGKGFYISRQDNIFRLEIKIKKEILVDEKSIDS